MMLVTLASSWIAINPSHDRRGATPATGSGGPAGVDRGGASAGASAQVKDRGDRRGGGARAWRGAAARLPNRRHPRAGALRCPLQLGAVVGWQGPLLVHADDRVDAGPSVRPAAWRSHERVRRHGL